MRPFRRAGYPPPWRCTWTCHHQKTRRRPWTWTPRRCRTRPASVIGFLPPAPGASLAAGDSDAAPYAKIKLDELFFTWLSRPDIRLLVASLLEDAAAGRPLPPPPQSSMHGRLGRLRAAARAAGATASRRPPAPADRRVGAATVTTTTTTRHRHRRHHHHQALPTATTTRREEERDDDDDDHRRITARRQGTLPSGRTRWGAPAHGRAVFVRGATNW